MTLIYDKLEISDSADHVGKEKALKI